MSQLVSPKIACVEKRKISIYSVTKSKVFCVSSKDTHRTKTNRRQIKLSFSNTMALKRDLTGWPKNILYLYVQPVPHKMVIQIYLAPEFPQIH